jgi:Fumarylacetoacetate (FAA) hydrolase family
MSATSFVIPPPPQASIAVAGDTKAFPVRRIWCVGRNYLEHIREMGNDERAPPFFFAKHADMLEADGATIPYPPLTKDLHHEVELIVAMKSGGLNIPADKALEHIYGYAVGIDLTRRDLQLAARKKERPWEVGLEDRPPHQGQDLALGQRHRTAEGRSDRTDLERAGDHLAIVATGRARRRRYHHDRDAGRRRGARAR